ncbi:hypothetical protein [Methanohalobium evestigatum]|uniref:hypothetical protein n=1 Tax=Methanohalobium evestigatum TaxID=2322 RepID=UPI000677DF9B|nr:hypothetical protein [Methanohalobium evestigatum]
MECPECGTLSDCNYTELTNNFEVIGSWSCTNCGREFKKKAFKQDLKDDFRKALLREIPD